MAGFRFLLACYVMFMHIGSSESWQAFSNLRQFPWHVHTFFAVAGFSLAIVMPSPIQKKTGFVASRILSFYPMYMIAVLFAFGNLLVSCHPSSFDPIFQWMGSEGSTCQGTPLIQESWWANLVSTLLIHAAGLQASPLWQASWWMGFYLWFISMYIQCLIFFPFAYNALHKLKGQTGKLVIITVGLLAINVFIVLGYWYIYAANSEGYGVFDPATGMRMALNAEQITIGAKENANVLSFYLFAPFWAIYFIGGMATAFIYDAVRPAEWIKKHLWGYVADVITCVFILFSILQVAQGYIPASADVVSLDTYFMRPEAANSLTDPAIVNRIWDNIYPRLFAPITLLWMFALATGQGLTARVLNRRFIYQILAPTTFGCFLFHQMVGQWYFAITRNGAWWNWCSDQKTFYWFSPKPLAVEWYEYFYIVGLVVLFARAIEPADPLIRRLVSNIGTWFKGKKGATQHMAQNSLEVVLATVEKMTGLEAMPEETLEECGMASLSVMQFIGALEQSVSSRNAKVKLSIENVLRAQSLNDVALLLDEARGIPTNTSGGRRVSVGAYS